MVRGRAAHGSTPWLGDNAIVKAIDVFRRIESMPFSRESSELFDRPSINLGRIVGGDAPNKVPDDCVMDVDIRYLPNQDPGDILEQIRAIPDIEVKRTFIFPPAHVSRSNPYVRALSRGRRRRRRSGESVSRRPRRRVGRRVVPRGRHPGGRVRPGRRRPPRPGGVGLDPLARPLPRAARRLRPRRPGPAGRGRRRRCGGRGRSGVKDKSERPPRVGLKLALRAAARRACS